MKNALTVDVEDWYQTNDFNIPRGKWSDYEDRVENNTLQLLDLLDQHGVRATFFILGCVAQKHPDLIREIDRRKHEIGTHGGWHQMIDRMTIEQFREDLLFSKQALEGIIGRTVRLYRAPSWSITPERYEVLHILQEEGFICDSSFQPFFTPLSGIKNAPCVPFHPVLSGKRLNLVEWPSTVLQFAGLRIPFSGGFYLRAMPYSLISRALSHINRTRPAMIYIHPWELDERHPRIKGPFPAAFIHYYNLHTTRRKLERLFERFAFQPLGEIMANDSYPEIALR